MLINKEMLLDALKDREWLYYEDAAFAVNHIVEKIRDFPEAISKDEFAHRLRQPDEIHRVLYTILDALDFKTEMETGPHCKNCTRVNCEWRTDPREIRYNCIFWTDEEWEDPEEEPEAISLTEREENLKGIINDLFRTVEKYI